MDLKKLSSLAYGDSPIKLENLLLRYVTGRWFRVVLDNGDYYRFRLTKIGSEYYGCVRFNSNRFGYTLPSSTSVVTMFENIYDWITR